MAETYPSDADLAAMSGGIGDTGIPHITTGEAPHFVNWFKRTDWLDRVLYAIVNGLRVFKDGDLTFGVAPGRYFNGATAVNYAGAAAQALTNNQTNYIYLTAAGALTVNITGFPTDGTRHVPLATILTAAGVYAHTDLVDYRGRAAFRPVRAAVSTVTVPLTDVRRTGDLSALPAAGDGTNLGLTAGAHGTATPKLISAAVGAGAAGTEKCRCLAALPENYIASGALTLRVHARGVDLAVTSMTVDAEVYESDREAGVGADLCATAAQSVNADTNWHDLDFTITDAGLAPGDLLDIELTVAMDDGGGGGDGAQAEIGSVQLLADLAD